MPSGILKSTLCAARRNRFCWRASSSRNIGRVTTCLFGTTNGSSLCEWTCRRNGRALRQTLNFMRKKFGVLTFGRGAPTERELKSATYQVPVRLSEISAEQYRERVAHACEFLEGKSREMIAALEAEMRKAAEKMDFEKAAELR